MLIEFDITPGIGHDRYPTAGIIADELEAWSEQYQTPIQYKLRKNTLILCFENDETYTFFGLTFKPKPTYTSGKPIEGFECKWRLLSDHEVQHRQNQ